MITKKLIIEAAPPPKSSTTAPAPKKGASTGTVTPAKEEAHYRYWTPKSGTTPGSWSTLLTMTELKKEIDDKKNAGRDIRVWTDILDGSGEPKWGRRGKLASEVGITGAPEEEEKKAETPWNQNYPECAKAYREAQYPYNGVMKSFYEVPVNVMEGTKSRGRIMAILTDEKFEDGTYKAILQPAAPSGEGTAKYNCSTFTTSGTTGTTLTITDLSGNPDVYKVGEFKSALTPEKLLLNVEKYNGYFGIDLFTDASKQKLNIETISQATSFFNEKVYQNYRGNAIGNFIILLKNLYLYSKATGDEATGDIKTQGDELNTTVSDIIKQIELAGFKMFNKDTYKMTFTEQSQTISFYQEMKKAQLPNYNLFTDIDPSQKNSYTELAVSQPPFGKQFPLFKYNRKAGVSDIIASLEDYAEAISISPETCQKALDDLFRAASYGPFVDQLTGKKFAADVIGFDSENFKNMVNGTCTCSRQGFYADMSVNQNLDKRIIQDNVKKINILSNDSTPELLRLHCGLAPDVTTTTTKKSQIQQNENNMRIKNMLKKKLVEVKETKTKIIQESNIINTRFDFILESANVKTKKQLSNLFEKTILEMVYLHNQGFDKKLIGESLENMFGVLSNLFKGKDEQIAKEFRNTGVNMILSSLNIENNPTMREYLSKSLNSTDTKDIPALLTDPKFLADKLAEASIESYMETLSENMGGEFMNAVNTSIKDVLKKSDLKDKIQNRITGITGPIVDRVNRKFEDKLQSVKSSLVSKKDIQA